VSRAWASILATLVLAAPAGGASHQEYALKAAFLLNFARLVEWPAEVRPGEGEPLVVAVMGSASVRRVIAQGLEGARAGSHPLEVRRLENAAQIPGSHIVFVAGRGEPDAELLDRSRSHKALSVGESPGFARRGGVIGLFTEEKKLRFEINVEAAKGAGIQLSSRLLRLARIIGD
jgi:hypothetical protein